MPNKQHLIQQKYRWIPRPKIPRPLLFFSLEQYDRKIMDKYFDNILISFIYILSPLCLFFFRIQIILCKRNQHDQLGIISPAYFIYPNDEVEYLSWLIT